VTNLGIRLKLFAIHGVRSQSLKGRKRRLLSQNFLINDQGILLLLIMEKLGISLLQISGKWEPSDDGVAMASAGTTICK